MPNSKIYNLRTKAGKGTSTGPEVSETNSRVPVLALAATMAGVSEVVALPNAEEDIPTSIGRYLIIRRLGVGGMGEVFAGYDCDLDRKIAIKVLHREFSDIAGRRSDRLMREAQAMARVSHPNLVSVHEVGTADGQVFIAMEYVEGPTLQQWLSLEQRDWPEVIELFRQAAQGLAALHREGLVHRDVKPSNMIVGTDGRLRVLDLGLVGVGNDDTRTEPRFEPSWSGRMGPLTRTGEFIGTPAYMSREQFLKLELTPASDIFSLSIALFEALYNVHPFMADEFRQLRSNVVLGRVREIPEAANVPGWLHRAVLAGLATKIEERPPSMLAFSDTLIAPRRASWRWVGTAATACAAALVAMVATWANTQPPPPSCDGAQSVIASVWNPEQARRLTQAMHATGLPYAEPLALRVVQHLDDYTKTWAANHRNACEAYVRGDHSAKLLDARMACLDRHRQALSETVLLLTQADAEVVDHAGQMVGKLPRVRACDDLDALTKREVPEDPELLRVVLGLQEKLVRATALANAGRLEDATRTIREVASEAAAIEHPATLAAALLTAARASINLQLDRAETGEDLDRALTIAIRAGLDRPAAEAMIRRVYVRGLQTSGNALAQADLTIAEAMLERAGDPPELRALLLNNAGSVHLAGGQRMLAEQEFHESLALKERLFGPYDLEVAVSLANLGMLANEAPAREQLHGRMVSIYSQQLGPEHPQTLDARVLKALYTANPGRASDELETLCRRFERHGNSELAGVCAFERGRIEVFRGRSDEAIQAFSQAQPFMSGEQGTVLAAYLAGEEVGDPQPVVDEIQKILVATDDPSSWWGRLQGAELRFLRARLLTRTGDRKAAISELGRVRADLKTIEDQAPPVERERLDAAAIMALLEADASGESRILMYQHVMELEADARSYFSRWPEACQAQIEHLNSFGDAHPQRRALKPPGRHPAVPLFANPETTE